MHRYIVIPLYSMSYFTSVKLSQAIHQRAIRKGCTRLRCNLIAFLNERSCHQRPDTIMYRHEVVLGYTLLR